MTVFRMYMARLFKNKIQLILLMVLPVFFSLLTASGMVNDGGEKLKLYVEDNDNSAFSKEIATLITSNAIMVSDVPDIQKGLIDSTIDYALVIGQGAANSILNGETDLSGKISGYYLKNSYRSQAAQKYLDTILAKAVAVAGECGGDANKLVTAVASSVNGDSVKINKIGGIDRRKSYTGLGALVLFAMLGSVIYTVLIIGDKEKRTMNRSLAAPIRMKSYLFQAILAFLFIAVIHVTFLMLGVKSLIGVYLGDSFLNMYIMFLLLALFTVSFGVAIAGFTKSIMQAVLLEFGIIFPMSFLGGCWWETKVTGEVMDTIGKFFPPYWIMDGMNKVLHNKPFSDITINIIISLLFAAVLFMLGSWRKQEAAA